MGIRLRDLRGRILKGNNLKHGLSDAPVYDCWIAMKARCLNPRHPVFSNYGGRGIKVCDRWLHSFQNFLEDMGERNSGYTLDRINNDGDYFPDNCRWISIQDQQKNRSNNNIVPGVVFEKDRKRWRSEITRHRTKYFLGRYKTFEEAVFVRKEAEDGFFYPNHRT